MQGRVLLASGRELLASKSSADDCPVLGAGVPPQQLGQIQLTRFINKVGLESIGDNLFVETAGSGPAIDGLAGEEGFGTMQQNYLEEGNVQAVTELSSLIAAQRAYEMNSKVISAADQMMQSTTQIMR